GTVYPMTVVPSGAAPAAAMVSVPASAAPATDPLDIPLPEPRVNVFAALGDFHEAQDLFDRLARLLDRIAQGPAGEMYRRELVRTATDGQVGFACPALRVSRGQLAAAEPYCAYCPRCQQAHPGWAHPACKTCGGQGWTTRAAFEACQNSERQPILAMRTANPK